MVSPYANVSTHAVVINLVTGYVTETSFVVNYTLAGNVRGEREEGEKEKRERDKRKEKREREREKKVKRKEKENRERENIYIYY